MDARIQPDYPVAVIGGGWAGLAAAVHLTQAGVPVTLFESARQLGGRARCVSFNGLRVDNGQHLMIGAYHGLLDLLKVMDIDEKEVFERRMLTLDMRAFNGDEFRVRVNSSAPPPLNLLGALLGARQISWVERFQLLRFVNRLRTERIALERDITAQALLISERQSSNLIRRLWAPLCLASLNTPIGDASAVLFMEVLRRTFSEDPGDSDLLFARTDLGTAIPAAAFEYIEAHGGKVILSKRIHDIEREADRFRVHWHEGRISASHVIVATNPVISRRLLSNHAELRPITDRLARLQQSPICTLYLRYPPQVSLNQPMKGVIDGTAQWIFDRAICGQRGLMAVVISGPGRHMEMDNDTLTDQIVREIAQLYPDWPPPKSTRVIREKRATFYASVDVDRLRPENRTSIPGLWLAGDYTATGLPATLEGAVLSGRSCAARIIEQGITHE